MSGCKKGQRLLLPIVQVFRTFTFRPGTAAFMKLLVAPTDHSSAYSS
jgi:hypothetical protein